LILSPGSWYILVPYLILLLGSHNISVSCLIQPLNGIKIPPIFLRSWMYTMNAELIIHCIKLLLVAH
jgi:hypothetical protein